MKYQLGTILKIKPNDQDLKHPLIGTIIYYDHTKLIYTVSWSSFDRNDWTEINEWTEPGIDAYLFAYPSNIINNHFNDELFIL